MSTNRTFKLSPVARIRAIDFSDGQNITEKYIDLTLSELSSTMANKVDENSALWLSNVENMRTVRNIFEENPATAKMKFVEVSDVFKSTEKSFEVFGNAERMLYELVACNENNKLVVKPHNVKELSAKLEKLAKLEAENAELKAKLEKIKQGKK